MKGCPATNHFCWLFRACAAVRTAVMRPAAGSGPARRGAEEDGTARRGSSMALDKHTKKMSENDIYIYIYIIIYIYHSFLVG